MSRLLKLHLDVLQEIKAAREWYSQTAFGLDGEFTKCVADSLDRVYHAPSSHPAAQGEFRQASLDRFPYQLIYRIGREQVFVLGLFRIWADPKASISPLAGG